MSYNIKHFKYLIKCFIIIKQYKEIRMKLRKLILFLLVAVVTFNVSALNASAAEEQVANQEQGTEEAPKDDNVTKEEIVETTKYTKAELRLLSALIYCEAQGENYRGKIAVGIVVMNRVRSKLYPDTLKDVIYQKYQFSPVSTGSLKKALSEYDKGNFTSAAEIDSIKAAKIALNGTTKITIKGKKKDFGKYLSFSGRLRGYTYRFGNHQFK